MTKAGQDAILQAAAKRLSWELHAAAGYSLKRRSVDIERFDRELRSVVRDWRVTRKHLKRRKEQ